MKIAVDLDDVVLDFVGGLQAAMKKEYDVVITDEQIDSFNLQPLLNPVIGRSWWAWLRDRDWLWPNFPAVDGAIGSLERLRLEGHYLICITSKPEWAEAAVWKWMGKWRPPFQQVIIVNDEVKADMTDAQVLIDDKMENVLAWALTGRTAILFDRPHNRKQGLPKVRAGVGPIIRAVGWGQVLEQLRLEEDPTQ